MPHHAHRDVELGEAAGDECLQARGPCGPRLRAPRPALPVYVRRVRDRRVLGPGLCLTQSVLPQGGGGGCPAQQLTWGHLLSNGLHALWQEGREGEPRTPPSPSAHQQLSTNPGVIGQFQGWEKALAGTTSIASTCGAGSGRSSRCPAPPDFFSRRTNPDFCCSKHFY